MSVPAIATAREALAQGNVDLAESLAAKILSEAPDHIDALEIRALVAAERGDYPAAERSLRAAIAAAPERRWPYADLTRLLIRLERHAEAEEVAQAAVAADAANPDAHAILGSLLAERGLPFEA